jgi:hypothetical protein
MPLTEFWAAHYPTRADKRAARQILADLVEGEVSPALEDLTFGPLDSLSRFLAGCGLCFLLIRDERGWLRARGGPSAESVALLVDCLLGRAPPPPAGPPPGPAAGSCLPSAVAAFREPWIESAVDQIVDGLHQRGFRFIFGWQLPGQSLVRRDHSLVSACDAVDDYLEWFLRRRLSICVDVTVASDASAMATVGGPT